VSGPYRAVHWNRQKRIYDRVLLLGVFSLLAGFAALTAWGRPELTAETIILRSTAVTALLLLHLALAIGPVARLDRRFLPLLYNRRHLGVTIFALGLIHALIATFQFHALGDVNPIVSIFTAYSSRAGSWEDPSRFADLPFEPFGALALLILFLLAATSHDFWLRNLGASLWKLLHTGVYIAYAALVLHVSLGALQSEQGPAGALLLALGALTLGTLHLLAGRREARLDARRAELAAAGFARACRVEELRDGYGCTRRIGAERVAIFRDGDRVHALSNTCRHQGGPIGEGRILDGCITCPWHGWQYQPSNGTSPPPFHEVIATYPVEVVDGEVLVKGIANPLEAESPGAPCTPDRGGATGEEPFYIGYQPTAAPAIARRCRALVLRLAILSFFAVVWLALDQEPQAPGTFEFGRTRTFEGTLVERPLPLLRIDPPEGVDGPGAAVVLVGFGKQGLPDFARGHHGERVRFDGTLIAVGALAMVEMNDPESFVVLGEPESGEGGVEVEALGSITLVGELVDTKCWFGVMRPAAGKVHRACAIRCLSGGVPPGLLVRDGRGGGAVFLLAGRTGAPLDFDVEWAGLPISVSGELELHEDLPLVRVATIEPMR